MSARLSKHSLRDAAQDVDETELVASVGRAECRRFYILSVFSAASAIQGLLWMTYSSVPQQAAQVHPRAWDDNMMICNNLTVLVLAVFKCRNSCFSIMTLPREFWIIFFLKVKRMLLYTAIRSLHADWLIWQVTTPCVIIMARPSSIRGDWCVYMSRLACGCIWMHGLLICSYDVMQWTSVFLAAWMMQKRKGNASTRIKRLRHDTPYIF